jgi:hypothetical protein
MGSGAGTAARTAVLKVWPNTAFAVRANRAFPGRAVRCLAAEAGIRHFLDIGAGLPTASNVHKVAQLELVPPGVVPVSDWRPDTSGPRPTPAEVSTYGGGARKP